MSIEEDVATIEAALYAADRPLALDEIRKIVGTSSETYTRKILDQLEEKYNQKNGPLDLKASDQDTFSLELQEDYMPKLEGIIPKTKLTRGALKTLAVIAYKQPIKQSELAEIRGGRVYQYVKQLLELGFIEAKPLKRTKLLRTSKKFAGYFGFEDQIDKIREKLQQMTG
ncbi:MAG: SMC-Scp complex subunit ScpB [Hadesarchaea archaeon]|nr:SMC-Scp complex subunit ScpB [Hadesarchaea archaeon]